MCFILCAEDSASFSQCSATPETVGFGISKEEVDKGVQSAEGQDFVQNSTTAGKRKLAKELFPEPSRKGRDLLFVLFVKIVALLLVEVYVWIVFVSAALIAVGKKTVDSLALTLPLPPLSLPKLF